MDYIITTEHLTKKYKNFTSVNHVSLHIRKGSIYGFLGPNGAGKSTTMKMLLGLTAPTKAALPLMGNSFRRIGLPFSKRSALSSKRRLSTRISPGGKILTLSAAFWDCRKLMWKMLWNW